MIKAGEAIPSVPVKLVGQAGTEDLSSQSALEGARVVFFTVPGAFTPTCHVNHLPGFISHAAKLHGAGVTRIVCGTVNDHHVVKAWAENTGAFGVVEFIADGSGVLAKATGLDRHSASMGIRFARSAMLIENGVVRHVFVEDAPGVSGSGAPAILVALGEAVESQMNGSVGV